MNEWSALNTYDLTHDIIVAHFILSQFCNHMFIHQNIDKKAKPLEGSQMEIPNILETLKQYFFIFLLQLLFTQVCKSFEHHLQSQNYSSYLSSKNTFDKIEVTKMLLWRGDFPYVSHVEVSQSQPSPNDSKIRACIFNLSGKQWLKLTDRFIIY